MTLSRVLVGAFAGLMLFSACDGSHYKVTIEYQPEEKSLASICYSEEICYGCMEDVDEDNDEYNPNLVDPYSEDTNWYIDNLGNIVWQH